MRDDLFELHAAQEESHWWFVGRRRIMSAVVAAVLPPAAEGTVIDVGCGTGGNLGALVAGYRCVGLEPSDTALRLARARYPEATFVGGEDPALLAEFATTNTVFLCMDVLEHVSDDFLVFSRLLAIMPVGAHLLITVPADPGLWSPHDVEFQHFRRYGSERLRRLWVGAPVSERLFAPMNTRLHFAIKGLRRISRVVGRGSGKAGSDLGALPSFVNRLLAGVFGGEARDLVARIDHPAGHRPTAGVSLLALLRREAGTVVPRTRPSDVAPDDHRPAAG